jgi:hypothetical protein
MALEYISQPQVFMAPITALGGIEGYVDISLNTTNLTANTLSADFADFVYMISDAAEIVDLVSTKITVDNVEANNVEVNNLVAYKFFLIPETLTLEASSTINLPQDTTDIELSGNSPVVISGFVNQTKGVTYTITNQSVHTMTISSSPTVYVRNGTAWRSNTFNLSSAYLELPYGTSCCVRGANGFVSVW